MVTAHAVVIFNVLGGLIEPLNLVSNPFFMNQFGLQSTRNRIRNKTCKQQGKNSDGIAQQVDKHCSTWTYSGLPAEARLDLDPAPLLATDEAPRLLLVRGIFSSDQRLTIDRPLPLALLTHSTLFNVFIIIT